MVSQSLLKKKSLLLTALFAGLTGLRASGDTPTSGNLNYSGETVTLTGIGAPLPSAASAAVAAPSTILPPGVASYLAKSLNPIGWSGSDLSAITGGQSAGYVQDASGASVHAAFWASATASIVDLHPLTGTYITSHVLGEGARQIVGIATQASGSLDHAMLWTMGQGANGVDLNPKGFKTSYAKATSGVLQAGYGYISQSSGGRALVWAGTADSATDITPAGFFSAEALGAGSGYEVGDGAFIDSRGVELHAMLWTGMSSGARDIHPTNIAMSDSRAVTVSGGTVGGFGTSLTGYTHALFWSALNGASVVDLNPQGYLDSQVAAANGSIEVGYGHLSTDSNTQHALLWSGSADTFVDLNQYLPPNYGTAMAQSIDANGNIAGLALNTVTGQYEAVVWSPVALTPEPSALLPLAGMIGSMMLKRKRVKSRI